MDWTESSVLNRGIREDRDETRASQRDDQVDPCEGISPPRRHIACALTCSSDVLNIHHGAQCIDGYAASAVQVIYLAAIVTSSLDPAGVSFYHPTWHWQPNIVTFVSVVATGACSIDTYLSGAYSSPSLEKLGVPRSQPGDKRARGGSSPSLAALARLGAGSHYAKLLRTPLWWTNRQHA